MLRIASYILCITPPPPSLLDLTAPHYTPTSRTSDNHNTICQHRKNQTKPPKSPRTTSPVFPKKQCPLHRTREDQTL